METGESDLSSPRGGTARQGQAGPPSTADWGTIYIPGNNGGVGIKCEHQASQDKYIENQATNTNGQTDFNWTLKAATIPGPVTGTGGTLQHFSECW